MLDSTRLLVTDIHRNGPANALASVRGSPLPHFLPRHSDRSVPVVALSEIWRLCSDRRFRFYSQLPYSSGFSDYSWSRAFSGGRSLHCLQCRTLQVAYLEAALGGRGNPDPGSLSPQRFCSGHARRREGRRDRKYGRARSPGLTGAARGAGRRNWQWERGPGAARPCHGPPVGPGAPTRPRPPRAASQRAALVRAGPRGQSPLRPLAPVPSRLPGSVGASGLGLSSPVRRLESWDSVQVPQIGPFHPQCRNRGRASNASVVPSSLSPQRAELCGGHRLVPGAGFPAADPAHLHVGERHGLHHGGGAFCGRRPCPEPCPGLRCPPQEVGVSSKAMVMREAMPVKASELCSEALFVSPGLCQWPGWSGRCGQWGWRSTRRVSPGNCPFQMRPTSAMYCGGGVCLRL